jgi:hypothetical protein
MGWSDTHLHQFSAGEITYGMVDEDASEDQLDEADFTLEDITKSIDSFIYEYDFGCSWIHHLEIEERLFANEPLKYAVALSGEEPCPLEDSREGIQPLFELTHHQASELDDVRRGPFDFSGHSNFDIATVNARLQQLW